MKQRVSQRLGSSASTTATIPGAPGKATPVHGFLRCVPEDNDNLLIYDLRLMVSFDNTAVFSLIKPVLPPTYTPKIETFRACDIIIPGSNSCGGAYCYIWQNDKHL